MRKLENKVALVTGASKGIGRGVALALAHSGASLVLAARDEGELRSLAREISDKGGRAAAIVIDLRDTDEVASLPARATLAFGRVDILVNNAAIPGPVGPFLKQDIKRWIETQTLNVFTPVRLTHALLPFMLERRWGRILNMSSGAARMRVGEAQNAYGSSKAALETHTIKLAIELRDSGVTANVLRPGATDTPMQTHMRNLDPEEGGPAIEVFKSLWRSGLIKPVDLPVSKTIEMLESDDNGLIVEMRRQKNAAGDIEDVVEALDVIG